MSLVRIAAWSDVPEGQPTALLVDAFTAFPEAAGEMPDDPWELGRTE